MKNCSQKTLFFCCIVFAIGACTSKNQTPSKDLITSLDLKKGEVIACGQAEGQFGNISFDASIPDNLRRDFNTAVALLHSFEYDESEKVFAKLIEQDPGFAMAYWGVAMSNFHPLWAPPSPQELEKGAKAISIAQSIDKKTKREADYINAIAKFYEDTTNLAHRQRVLNFEKAMEKIYSEYKDDKEASVFYALALNAAADPTDKTYSRQKKAYSILNKLFQQEPQHPGIAHYIIHNYDYPDLAELALPAARRYASIAPASSHAQHMPSHIFTRLGLWDESIQSNLVAASSAKCYAEQAKIKGHWDEELHAMDYLVYGYLQKGEDELAKAQLDYLGTMQKVYPVNFKVLYAFAAIPARYYLEKRIWDKAATMEFYPAGLPWENFLWQKAIVHFTRVLGLVHLGKTTEAQTELQNLKALHQALTEQKNMLREAAQVAVQIKASEAWIEFKKGNNAEALELMKVAAALEDASEKHPVTPGEVIPARELLADMLMEMHDHPSALNNYQEVLRTHPNRFNALYGAATAAQRSNNKKEAQVYFKKLMDTAPKSKRKELEAARSFAG